MTRSKPLQLKPFFAVRWSLALLVCCCLVENTRAQDVKLRAGFLSDSVKIGEQTAFYLSAHYPQKLTILFPDSTIRYSPFEFHSKKYFSTETTDSISVDSALYYLSTFEIDSVQYLDLPVYIVQAQDCTVVASPRDSIWLSQLVSSVPDSLTAAQLPLKMNTAYQRVNFEFNYWFLMIGLGILLVLLILAWIFFGKRFMRYWKARSLKREHSQFIETYNSIIQQLRSAFSSLTTESALSTWKKYMEQLEAQPYTKLTTKETLALLKDEKLGQNLSSLDTAIYGHNTSVVEYLENLKAYADHRFSKKLEEVKHGK